MEFWKMNGAGNDFIVVDDRRNAIPENRWPEIVRVLCERHMSIGADGFMVVKPPTCGGDYKMLFFNSDGSMVRCAATARGASAATAMKTAWPVRHSG